VPCNLFYSVEACYSIKKCYGAEILYGSSWSNCGWKIDKINKKKYEGKKCHAEDRTQILTKLTAIFKFPRHLQKLVQNNNWCSMVCYRDVFSSYTMWKNGMEFQINRDCLSNKLFFRPLKFSNSLQKKRISINIISMPIRQKHRSNWRQMNWHWKTMETKRK
jgi:hypothetical protein